MSARLNRLLWAQEALWPPEEPGWYFLVRAARKIGRSKFGVAWSDQDLAADEVALRALQQSILDPPLPRSIVQLPHVAHRPTEPTKHQASLSNELSAALDRRYATLRTIVERCFAGSAAGGIASAYRDMRTGQLVEMPLPWWSDHSWPRFNDCDIDWTKPFEQYGGGSHRSKIFLRGHDVDNVSAELERISNPLPNWAPLQGVTLNQWCTDAKTEAGAKADLEEGANETAICKRMTAVWRNAGRSCGDKVVAATRYRFRSELNR